MIEIPGLYRIETHLFSKKSKGILSRLKPITAPPKRSNRHKKEIIYNGHINSESFEIFRNIVSPQFIVPIISGRVIDGENETLLNLHFKLFEGAILFVILWTSILSLATLYTYFVMNNVLYAGICILLALGNYLIVKGNFDMHSKKNSEELVEILRSE